MQHYRVVRSGEGWGIETNDGAGGTDYLTKEAAFEACVAAASNAIKQGIEVRITVEGQLHSAEPALGAS